MPKLSESELQALSKRYERDGHLRTTEICDLFDTIDALRGELAEAMSRLAKGETKTVLEAVDERDKAEESFSQAYYLITGNSPEWSNNFGYDQAIVDIDDAQRCLRAEIKQIEAKLAPNPACGHPMAFRVMETPSEAWKRASTTGKDANGVDQGEYSGQFYCTLCQEKEAAVAAALEKAAATAEASWTDVASMGACKAAADCIRALITPTQTSAQYHAPDVSHIPDDLVSKRAVYRMIERMAGMSMPQVDRDCMGEPFVRPDAKPEEIYRHVLKGIESFPTTQTSAQQERK